MHVIAIDHVIITQISLLINLFMPDSVTKSYLESNDYNIN